MSESDRKRPQRVGELLQHELANVITHELKDPRVGFVTVTEVRVSGDLRLARVFVSILGNAEQRASSLDGLRAACGYLKRIIAERVDLRWVPELVFEADETLDRAERLEALMQAIAKGETEAPPPAPLPPVAESTYRSELAERQKLLDQARGRPAARPRRRPRR